MSGATLLLVGLAGAVGALLRAALTSRTPARATVVVNVLGALALGVVTVALDGTVRTVVATGLLGATTTFSSWVVHAEQSARPVRWLLAPLLLGCGAAALGRGLAMLVA